MEDRIQKLAEAYTAKYGKVPPPYVVFDDHPYSLRWRMGPGEDFFRMWWGWWAEQPFSEDEKLAYFKEWPPPHRWLGFVMDATWDIDPARDVEQAVACFDRMSALGFGDREDYERDLQESH
jgi:hypothetical protein